MHGAESKLWVPNARVPTSNTRCALKPISKSWELCFWTGQIILVSGLETQPMPSTGLCPLWVQTLERRGDRLRMLTQARTLVSRRPMGTCGPGRTEDDCLQGLVLSITGWDTTLFTNHGDLLQGREQRKYQVNWGFREDTGIPYPF